jgi:hypothetical protein
MVRLCQPSQSEDKASAVLPPLQRKSVKSPALMIHIPSYSLPELPNVDVDARLPADCAAVQAVRQVMLRLIACPSPFGARLKDRCFLRISIDFCPQGQDYLPVMRGLAADGNVLYLTVKEGEPEESIEYWCQRLLDWLGDLKYALDQGPLPC